MKRIVKTIPAAKSVINLFESLADRTLDLLLKKFPQWKYNYKKRKWINRWYSNNFSPSWMITRIPQEIQEAVDSGWFPPDASLVDIGCGSGEIAAWLATKNFQVMGIDYASSAIERAKSKHGEIPGKLEFKTIDICADSFGGTQFNALIDRGCFHTIPKAFHSDYVNSVASCFWCRLAFSDSL